MGSSLIFSIIDPALIALSVAIITALGTYLAAARRLSGRIKNSEATELWAESRSIRDWSTSQIQELEKEIADLKNRLHDIELRYSDLSIENRKLIQDKYHLELLLEREKRFNEHLRWEAEHSPRRRRSDKHFIEEQGSEDE